MPVVHDLLAEEMDGEWCDPFAGMTSPAAVRNDLNPEAKADFHMDALDFLKGQDAGRYDGVLFDPPYSHRQASECYKSFGLGHLAATVTRNDYWAACKLEIARIVRPGGKAICFGWNTNGIGMKRGFEMERVLVIAHGSGINDTLVTVETKVASRLI